MNATRSSVISNNRNFAKKRERESIAHSDSEKESDHSDEDEIDDEERFYDNRDAFSYEWTKVDVELPVTHTTRRGGIVSLEDNLPPWHGKTAFEANGNRVEITELEFFHIFIDMDIIETFVASTNAYGNQKIKNWIDTCVDEMMAFFGCILAFGITKCPNREMGFNGQEFAVPFLQNTMSENRFNSLMNAWHFLDTTELSDEEYRKMKEADCFFLVRGLLDHLRDKFLQNYRPGRLGSVDESIMRWKGRHKARCFNKSKPHHYHLKKWSFCCFETGYIINSYPYEGEDETRPAHISASEFPVFKLTQPECLHKLGMIIVSDNFFTSPGTIEINSIRGNHAVGTVRSNRKGLPTFENIRNRERGHMEQYCTSMSHNPERKMYCVKWLDNKDVIVLSDFPSYLTECFRRRSRKDGPFRRMSVPQPSVIKTYNQGMGGVDSADQRLAILLQNIKTSKWPPRMMMQSINEVCFNASVLYRLKHKKDNHYSIVDFTIGLCKQLAKNWSIDSLYDNKRRSFKKNDSFTGIFLSKCYPVAEFDENFNPGEKKNQFKRLKCRVCFNKCDIKCAGCKVHLCVKPRDPNSESCWVKFHRGEIPRTGQK